MHVGILLQVPVPSDGSLLLYRNELRVRHAAGARSLRGLHPDIALPLWLVPFWTALRPVSEAHAAWKRGYTMYSSRLRGRAAPPHLEHIPAALEAFFETVGWNERLGPLCRAPQLASLFCDDWLDDRLMDSVTHIIAARALERPENAHIHFGDRDLYWYMDIKASDQRWEDYTTARRFAHLRALGDRIAAGEVKILVMPVNPHRQHWAVAEYNIPRREIRYGDSLGWSPDHTIMASVERWLAKHVEGVFRHCPEDGLPCTRQSDAFSCPVVTWNTMERRYLNASAWTTMEKHLRRAEYALLLAVGDGALTASDLSLPDGFLTRKDEPAAVPVTASQHPTPTPYDSTSFTLSSDDSEERERSSSPGASWGAVPSSPGPGPESSSPSRGPSPSTEDISMTENSKEDEEQGVHVWPTSTDGFTLQSDSHTTSSASYSGGSLSGSGRSGCSSRSSASRAMSTVKQKIASAVSRGAQAVRVLTPVLSRSKSPPTGASKTSAPSAPSGGAEPPAKRRRAEKPVLPETGRQSLLSFFPRVSKEEAERRRQVREEKEREQRAAIQEAAARHERHETLSKQATKREQARLRQQRKRDRERAAAAAGPVRLRLRPPSRLAIDHYLRAVLDYQ
jgi:hypothetical protein